MLRLTARFYGVKKTVGSWQTILKKRRKMKFCSNRFSWLWIRCSVAQKAVKSAAVYIHIPGEPHARLVRISAQGEPLENLLAVHEENGTVYLACRTAQSGWMNIANDIAYWLSLDEIQGGRNEGSGSQLSIPVATQNGTVLGVVHVEFADKDQADEAAQTDWSALALALAEPLKALAGIEDKEEEHE